MRLEGKNAHIKKLVGKNFKNLQYTIATRHQRYYVHTTTFPPPPNVHSSYFLYEADDIGKGVFISVNYYGMTYCKPLFLTIQLVICTLMHFPRMREMPFHWNLLSILSFHRKLGVILNINYLLLKLDWTP